MSGKLKTSGKAGRNGRFCGAVTFVGGLAAVMLK